MQQITDRPAWPEPILPAPPRSAKDRPLTWVILGWNMLMFAWIAYGVVATGKGVSDCSVETYADACATGTSLGGGLAIIGILFLTMLVDVILAVIWHVTKKEQA